MNWQCIFDAIPGAYYLMLDGIGTLDVSVVSGKNVLYKNTINANGRQMIQLPVHPTDTNLSLHLVGSVKMQSDPILIHSTGIVWPVSQVKPAPVVKVV